MKLRFKGNPTAIASLLVAICHCFASAESLHADCVAAPSGLIAWWRGENNALDSVVTNHGTLQNGATFISGEVVTSNCSVLNTNFAVINVISDTTRFYRLHKP